MEREFEFEVEQELEVEQEFEAEQELAEEQELDMWQILTNVRRGVQGRCGGLQ